MAFEASQLTRSVTRVSGFRDGELDYQLLRLLGLGAYGGSTVGECLSAASTVPDRDTAGWARAFGELADLVQQAGSNAEQRGHLVSAADHFLRASTYHRAAEYYLAEDPRSASLRGSQSRDCFTRSLALSGAAVEPVSVPFEGAALPGYLATANGTLAGDAARKVVVVLGGFDTSAEDLHLTVGVPGVQRGWTVLSVDGPGQMGAMRDHLTLTFRPDYEVPMAKVIDFVLGRSDLADANLALVGLSFGGYFAARVAAHDKRVKALVVDPPVIDLYRYMEAWLGPPVFGTERDIRPEDVMGVPEDLLLPQMSWGIAAVCSRFGVSSLQEWIAFLDRFRLGDSLRNISCPALGLVGEREGEEVVSQAKRFASALEDKCTLVTFGVSAGADAHAQVANPRWMAATIFDWLDERLG